MSADSPPSPKFGVVGVFLVGALVALISGACAPFRATLERAVDSAERMARVSTDPAGVDVVLGEDGVLARALPADRMGIDMVSRGTGEGCLVVLARSGLLIEDSEDGVVSWRWDDATGMGILSCPGGYAAAVGDERND